MANDIRWIQRFSNYLKAFEAFRESIALSKTRPLSNLEKQGLIQGFEYTHELAWNVLKDYLSDQGYTGLIGSKDTIRLAFKTGLITHGEPWMEMIQTRNLTSHTYEQSLAEKVFQKIIEIFFPVLQEFTNQFKELNQQNQND